MKQWRKFFVVPATIAIVSIFWNYIMDNNNFRCQMDGNFTTTCINLDFDAIESSYHQDMEPEAIETVRPKYWFHHPNGPRNHFIFETIDLVLQRLDLQKIDMNLTNMHDNWDIVWSYHFHDLQYLPYNWSKLKFYQKINHIPGNHHMISKSVFGTTTTSKYVPKAFADVQKLREYAAEHPEKRFVMKQKSNRGVELKKVSEMNFTENDNLLDYFAQEFIENPLLFNGHKFDFAIYVAVTSYQPLRVYYYTRNMIFRFCPKTYDISNPSDTDRYVVSDSKIPVWEFNGTKEYFDYGYNTKDAFEGYLKSIGANLDDIWEKIEDCIRSILMMKEKDFIYWTKVFKTSKFNHFELFRFDMILDTNFNLHLIEINQHPNLHPNNHFWRNRYLYENLLYNLFNLIGAGTTFKKESLKIPSMDVEKMIVNDHFLNISPEICMSERCRMNCSFHENCGFCKRCLTQNDKYEHLMAYREQMNLGSFKRIFPPEQKDFDKINVELWDQASYESRLHALWFKEMCKRERNFC